MKNIVFTALIFFSGVMRAEVPWSVGENLRFSVQYGAVTAGEAVMEVQGYETISGKQTYKFVSYLRTNDYFSKIFRIEDTYHSYMDIDLLSSRKFVKHIEEGSYTADREILFIPEMNVAIYDDEKFTIESNTQDLLSCIYFARTLPLTVGERYPINIHDSKKNFSGYIDVLRSETVSTPLGEFDCVVSRATVEGATIFASRDGLEVWYTNDKWHIPVLISLKIMIGSIQMVLVDADMGN
ncbi:DUF3108 domain-containing protein [candidate division WOR-3 bacterium]|nr:DUF3108 domain-containing protein [candidate division WOR-3 bacterium]